MSVNQKLNNQIKRHEQSIRTTGKYGKQKGKQRAQPILIDDGSEHDETDDIDRYIESMKDY